jgi:O-antigen chain-terminating methyltransferase
MEYYLTGLRSGAASKAQVLLSIVRSQEGQRVGARLPGLKIHLALDMMKRLPIAGPVASWLSALLLLEGQSKFTNAAIEGMWSRLAAMENDLALRHERLLQALGAFQKRLITIESDAQDTFEEVKAFEIQWNNRQAFLQQKIADKVEAISSSLNKLQAASLTIDLSPDSYARFEERFRGPEDMITERFRAYLPFVMHAHARTPGLPLLDLGCGRGEWLALLRNHGVAAEGVDINPNFVAHTRAMGLNVSREDAIAHLISRPDASLAAICAFHVLEHWSMASIVTFFNQAKRTLADGGLLILETPDPENPSVAGYLFYIDPTHRRPLPSQLLSFLAEEYDFEETKVLRLNGPPLEPLDARASGTLDYGLVAMRKERSPHQEKPS